MMKKEEDCEKLEEEVITLRVEVDKLNKNLKSSQVLEDILSCQRSLSDKAGFGYIGEASCKEDANANPNKSVEERGSSTLPIKKVEEKCYRLLERKNKEKAKSYVEVIKGPIKKEECEPSKENIPEMEKTQEEDYKRPSTSRYQRSFNHCEGNNRREDCDQLRHEFRRTTSQRRIIYSQVSKFLSWLLFYL
jgi:hypothetical protein